LVPSGQDAPPLILYLFTSGCIVFDVLGRKTSVTSPVRDRCGAIRWRLPLESLFRERS